MIKVLIPNLTISSNTVNIILHVPAEHNLEHVFKSKYTSETFVIKTSLIVLRTSFPRDTKFWL